MPKNTHWSLRLLVLFIRSWTPIGLAQVSHHDGHHNNLPFRTQSSRVCLWHVELFISHYRTFVSLSRKMGRVPLFEDLSCSTTMPSKKTGLPMGIPYAAIEYVYARKLSFVVTSCAEGSRGQQEDTPNHICRQKIDSSQWSGEKRTTFVRHSIESKTIARNIEYVHIERMNTYIPTYIHNTIYMYVYIYMYMYVCMYVCICMCVFGDERHHCP